jgi:hypothetical protein
MSAQTPAIHPAADDKHNIMGVEDVEQELKGENDTQRVIVTEEDVSSNFKR